MSKSKLLEERDEARKWAVYYRRLWLKYTFRHTQEYDALQAKLDKAEGECEQLAGYADELFEDANKFLNERDELQSRLNAAESGSLRQAQEYDELIWGYNKLRLDWQNECNKLDIAREALEWVHTKVYSLNPDMATLENYIERIKS